MDNELDPIEDVLEDEEGDLDEDGLPKKIPDEEEAPEEDEDM